MHLNNLLNISDYRVHSMTLLEDNQELATLVDTFLSHAHVENWNQMGTKIPEVWQKN